MPPKKPYPESLYEAVRQIAEAVAHNDAWDSPADRLHYIAEVLDAHELERPRNSRLAQFSRELEPLDV